MRKAQASLPELMAAASEVAFACSENEHEAYHLTQQALIELIKNLPKESDLFEFTELHLLSDRYVH